MSRFFDISPGQEAEAHSLERAVELIREAFPHFESDPAAALLDAKRRRTALLAVNAPKEIVAIYENPKVTRVRVTTDWSEGVHLEFDLWDRMGIQAYPKPPDSFHECEVLAGKLAEVLGYSCSTEEYD
jgi:hypothetical protein